MHTAKKVRSLGARVRLSACFVLSTLLAACAGGGAGTPTSGGSLIPGTSPLSTTVTTGTSPISTSGTVKALNSAGFLLNTGSPHGLIDVLTSKSTTVSGPAVYVGEAVSVSGVGSWSTNIAASSVALAGGSSTDATPTASPFAAPTGLVSTQGTIAGPRTGGGYTLTQPLPSGKLPITVASNALIVGGSIATGSYVTLTGTGSVHSSVAAIIVAVGTSAPTSTTVQGTIVGPTAYGFTLNVDSTHTAVPIILNSTAVIAGGVLSAGSTAKVTGPGTTSSTITAVQVVVSNPTPTPAPDQTPSPTPGPISQKHVLTADYLGGYYGTHSITWSAAAPILNWASTNATDANNISAAGIKTMYYTNPNRILSTDPMYTSNEAEYAHDCSGNRVTVAFSGETEYITNIESSVLPTLFASTITSKIAGAHFDALFADNTGSLDNTPGISAMPCNYTDPAWIAGEASVIAAAPRPVIFNGLSGLNGQNVSLSEPLVNGSNDIGGTFEHCFSDDSDAEWGGWVWTAAENTQLQVTAANKMFLCMALNTATASSTAAQAPRMFVLASFLMTYSPANSVLWEDFGTASGLHVFPESQIVPLNPVVAQPSNISALQTSGGTYGREYKTCYIAGNFVGPCAVAVNPDTQLSHAFPFPQYTHSLVFNGNGILDGGTVSTNGPSEPTYLPPLGAAVVFP